MANVMNKGTAIVGFVLSFVTGATFMYAVDRGNQGKDASASADNAAGGGAGGSGGVWKQDAAIPISNEDPAMGPKNAPVTVVEFSDYQCPYCSRVGPTLDALKETYGDNVRIVWKDLPLDFHKNALPAATAARVAFMAKGHEAFWKMNKKLFANQGQLSEENFVKWLAELGIDKATYDKNKSAAETKVKASLEEAKKLGIQGTPNFMIDGEPLTGAQPVDKFKAVVDAHLKKADELKKKGTPEAEIYAAMVKTHFKAAPEQKEPEEEPEDNTVWKADVAASPVLGKDDALVTIVEFSEFQCPFCKGVHDTLSKIKTEYGDKVRVIFKHNPLPFHNRAQPASNLAVEAYKQKGAAGFYAAYDKLFASQPKLEDADLETIAKDLGLDVKKTMDCVKALCHKDEIQKDLDQGEELGVKGTPHSFVNGRVVNGAQPYEKFKKIVDAELAKADAKVKAGTPAAKVYEETIKGGKGGPMPALAVPADAPWRGGRDARVVIQVFSDFQCPFCKRAEVPMPGPDGKVDPNGAGLKAATEKYGDKIKVVWRNFPLSFHNRAEPAAELAIEAFKQKGNDGFWKAHDALMDSQPKLEDADLEAVAKKIGIDWGKAKEAIDKKKYKELIDRDMKDGGSVGVTGTPAFIINGKSLVGAQPADAFYKAIDAALAKAK